LVNTMLFLISSNLPQRMAMVFCCARQNVVEHNSSSTAIDFLIGVV